MNAPRGHYRGVLDCARQTARAEGLAAFYRGFRASCLRLVRGGQYLLFYCCKYSRLLLQVSWNVVLWLSYEQLKLAVLRHCNNNNNK